MVRYCLLCLELTDLLMETAAESENEHREPGTPTWLEYLCSEAAKTTSPSLEAAQPHSPGTRATPGQVFSQCLIPRLY